MKIWRCPMCGTGVRAPKAMDGDDLRRYCIPCSEKTGSLIRRALVASLTARENRKAATEAKRLKLKEEQDFYPWCIQKDFQKLKKCICWTSRSLIKSIDLVITFSRKRRLAETDFDKRTAKLTLQAGTDRNHAYAVLFWQLAILDTAADRGDYNDVFFTATSAFLGRCLDEPTFTSACRAFKEYTDTLQETTVTNVKVRRRATPKIKKTRLGSAISKREKKAVW